MIEVVAPQIATPDRKAEADIIVNAIDRQIMSKRTARLRMDLDPDDEEKQIKKEQAEDLEQAAKQAEIQAKLNPQGAKELGAKQNP